MGMTWKQICADPVVAELAYRVESDEWGNIVMSPPPGVDHSRHQSRILYLLSRLMKAREALAEFPLQTSKGVKGVDTVWISDARLAQQSKQRDIAVMAPEICVEVYSPSNRRGEIEEKNGCISSGVLWNSGLAKRKGAWPSLMQADKFSGPSSVQNFPWN